MSNVYDVKTDREGRKMRIYTQILSERLSETAIVVVRCAAQVFEFIGGACRIRTYDHLIKSQMLYQLS